MSPRILKRLLAQRRAARFLVVGGGAAAVNWLVRLPLSWVLPFPAAVAAAAAVGMMAGFVLYRRFVFAGSGRPLWLEARDFIAVNLISSGVVVLLALACLRLMAQLGIGLRFAEAGAHAVAIGLGAVLNYLGHSMVTFRPRMRAARAS